MRKIFAEAHKAEIIARAYGKGREFGEIAEHLLDPTRINQCDIDDDQTVSDLARRLSNGSQLRLNYMYLAMAVDHAISTEERVETLLRVLEQGPAHMGLRGHLTRWDMN